MLPAESLGICAIMRNFAHFFSVQVQEEVVGTRHHASIEISVRMLYSGLQGMDTYSNILYVKEQFAALSHLAHRVAATDKYRPETCCIIGNYYSLKGQHEKVY